MSRWNHACCEQCWIERELKDNGEMRAPVMVKGDIAVHCCFCKNLTFIGIYVREDPDSLPCKGMEGGAHIE